MNTALDNRVLRNSVMPQLCRRIELEPELKWRHINDVAEFIGRSPTTVFRWCSDPSEQPKKLGRPVGSKFRVTDELVSLYFKCGSNAAECHRQAIKKGLIAATNAPSKATIRREIKRQVPRIDRVLAKHGEKGVRNDALVYLPIDTQYRTATFSIDHCELPIYVSAPHPYKGLRKPSITPVMDLHTRVIMGFVISIQPNSSVATAAMLAAVAQHPDELNPFQGRPGNVLTDNGSDFLSDHFMGAMVALGATQTVHPPYHPHLKGRQERFHGTLRTHLQGLPGFADGPRTADNKPQFVRELGYLHFSQVYGLIESIIDEYHNTVPEGSDLSPRQAWESDATPLSTVANRAELSWMLMKHETRVVTKNGISVMGKYFTCREISTRKGDRIGVRWVPHDDREIYLFDDDRYFATAVDPFAMTNEEKLAYVIDRKERRTQAKARVRRALRPNRMIALPATAAGVDPVVVVSSRLKEVATQRSGKVNPKTEIVAFGDLAQSYPEER